MSEDFNRSYTLVYHFSNKKKADLKISSGALQSISFPFQSTRRTSVPWIHAQDEFLTPPERRDRAFFCRGAPKKNCFFFFFKFFFFFGGGGIKKKNKKKKKKKKMAEKKKKVGGGQEQITI